MVKQPFSSPVEDTVPKVNDEVAVGEDLEFQRRWWTFERVVWTIFLLVIVADLLGVFGQGWVAKAEASASDDALSVSYERVERASTPATLRLRFGPSAIRDGRVQVYLSGSVVTALGLQRIQPQPQTATVGGGGVTYTFPASTAPASVQMELQPSAPGLHAFRIWAAHEPPIDRSVLVLP